MSEAKFDIDDWYFDTVLTTFADLSRLQTDTDKDIVKVVSENRSDLYLTEPMTGEHGE